MTWRPCIVCGEVSADSRCDEHQLQDQRPTFTQRGYNWRWSELSRRARRLQPFCTDCGTTDDLTVDHSPEAWRRQAAGLTIRLEDVDVVCRGCNTRRGRARPTGSTPDGAQAKPLGKAKSESENGSQIGGLR